MSIIYYYTSLHNPDYLIFHGKSKFENESLIKWGWPEDIWFHVADFSSAHVYVRLRDGETIDQLPPEVIEECAQLTKANSIQGCKEKSVRVNYTPWGNLDKRPSMDVGTIGFKKERAVKTVRIEKNRDLVKALVKTRRERTPDLEIEKRDRNFLERLEKQNEMKLEKKRKAEEEKARKEKEDLKSYSTLFDRSQMMLTNKRFGDEPDYRSIEEDFM